MRNQLSVLLIASLLITSSFGSYPASTYTTTCSGNLHLSAVPSVTCATAAACTTGYSDNAPASATTNSAGTATAAADCKYCAVSYVWDSNLYANCVATASGACATGYSDVAPTANVNAAANTHPTANCAYCATSYFQTSTMVGVTAATTFTCTNSAACTTGYSDKAPVSGANTAASTAPTTGNCIYCAPTYYWDSLLANNCILKSGSSTCATGYSDTTTGTASAAGSLTGNCVNCATNYYFDRLTGITGQTCILKTGASTCATGYSDVAPTGTTNAAASAAGSLTGNCVNCAVNYYQDRIVGVTGQACILKTGASTCATGYSDVAPVNATTNSAASAAGSLTGNCANCAVSYFMDRPTGVTGLSCVLKTSTTLGVCAAGYADASTGVASAAGSLAGNCKYCATGYSDIAPTGTTNAAATAAGAVAACKYCAPGYNQTAVGSACTATAATSANFMMVSISMLATLIMIIF